MVKSGRNQVSLAAGRSMLAIPGPSVMPDRVLNAMHRSSPNIYEGELIDLTHSLIPDLCAVARTKGNVAIYISNGHGSWEAALVNTLPRGAKVLVLSTGEFGMSWAGMARTLGMDVEVIEATPGESWDLEKVSAALSADQDHKIEAVLVTHVDTSTSVRNDIAELRTTLDDLGHPALILADCIASMGCDRFEMDEWGVDVTVAASQKGLMVPPGLSFVWFNEKAEAARDRLNHVSPYFDWRPRANPKGYYQYFAGTAPTHMLYGLREALDMLVVEEGVEAAWARHETLARAISAAADAWGAKGPLSLIVKDPALRSHAVTSLSIGAPAGTELRRYVEEQFGVTLGIGLGLADSDDPEWHGYFRIGHMGHVNAHMVLGTLAAVEAGMVALNIEHGAGGVAAATRVCAGQALS